MAAELTYHDHARDLNRELRAAISKERLTDLHHRRPWRHFWIAFRQIALLVGLPVWIYYVDSFWAWFPASVLLGFVIFSFSVLLHESVHRCIFRKKPRLNDLLGLVYGWISGLAFSQFKRWHLDHHDHLGSTHADPKRAHLSPRINTPWFKLLYCTPMLFPIYFRAVAETFKGYPEQLSRQIKRERTVGIVLHLGILTWFWTLDPWFAFKAHLFSGIFYLSNCFYGQPVGTALCHKSRRNCQLDNPHASQLGMEFSLSVFDISPGTPLFPGRTILQPAKIAKRTGTLFSPKTDGIFYLQSGALSLVYQKPRPPYAVRHHNIKQEDP